MKWPNFYPESFGFLILFENLYILPIILGYGNDKLHDCTVSISYLKRHHYVLLPFNNNYSKSIGSAMTRWPCGCTGTCGGSMG